MLVVRAIENIAYRHVYRLFRSHLTLEAKYPGALTRWPFMITGLGRTSSSHPFCVLNTGECGTTLNKPPARVPDQVKPMTTYPKLKNRAPTCYSWIPEHTCRHPIIHSLPVEILNIIFSDVCLSYGAEFLPFSLHIQQADGCWTIDAPAIFLSHVCKRWRAIATNSPNLWSSINIDVYRMPKDFRPLLKLYLCNAGKRPLRIRITDSQKSTWRQQGDYVADHLGFEGFEATWCLLRETRRLGALDLVLDEDFIYSPVSKATFIKEATSMSFPLLTCFNCSTFPDSLDNDRWFTEDDDDDASVDAEEDEVGSWFWDAIYENAPKLTSLVTDRLYNTQLLPYSQLTTLQIMRLNAHDWPHLLLTISTSLNLQNLSIHESYDPIDDDFSSISCCSLRTLRIEIWPVLRNLPRMFASLHLPSLRSFELHLLGPSVAEDALVCNAPESDWPCHTLLAISEACSATLTQLSVKTEDYAISANAMTRALAAMPNLVFLEVNAVRDAQESFAAGLVSGLMVEEARGGRDAVLMPKLRKLFVHETVSSSGGYSPYLEIAEDIVRMAELRSSLRSTSTLAILCLSHGSQKYTWDPAEVHVEFLGVGLVSRLEALEVNGTLCRVEWMSGSVDTENVTLG